MPPGLAPIAAPPAPDAAPEVSTASAPDSAGHDDLENDRTVLVPKKPRPQSKVESAGSTWVLVTPSGTREPITGIVVVGRQPAKTAFKGSDRSLALKDPEGQVSKSHAVFEVDGDGLWVRDLGSTNGVVVITPSGHETSVKADTRVTVPVGSEVELGGYVLTVERED